MGLASALSTALTGLTAAETTIDVVGNNLANSNTVGFKASEANFATQFLQTQSLGAAPTDASGGTNPRQVGLGTMVADITPNFTQGTIEISANATDLAIQGDGFFIVQGNAGELLYTRNGIFKMNADNEIVTSTGYRLLGYTVDDQFELITESLQALSVPLGSSEVAKATENVDLEGTLTPTGDLADTAEIIQTAILGDAQYSHPATEPTATVDTPPVVTASTATAQNGAGTLAAGSTYQYRIALADSAYGGDPDTEGLLSNDVGSPIALTAPDNQIYLDQIPNDPDYSYFRVYRSTDGGANYYYIGEEEYAVSGTTDFTDTGFADGAARVDDLLTGSYSYYVTFTDALGGPGVGNESRPSEPVDATIVSNGRIHLTDLPTDTSGNWVGRRIYRNVDGDENMFYFVAEIAGVGASDPSTFTDYVSDATIEATGETVDLDGPKITNSTLLSNVVVRDGDDYDQVFSDGTLAFTGKKGERTLSTKELEITATTTVQELYTFMEEALGIVEVSPDPLNPLPGDTPTGFNPGGAVADGRIRLVGNNGEANAIDVGLSGLQLTSGGGISSVNLAFSSSQTAAGEGAVADFIAYDSMGMPLSVRLTTVMESRDGTSVTYRWFADSADNSDTSGAGIAVGTGLISFDGEGNFVSATESTVSVLRSDVPSISPLEFELDFSRLSGLAADEASLAVSGQDGSAPGKLSSFIVGEDGLIRGVFSNGINRDLGQIRLARFGNAAGLEQVGENLYSPGVNSGLPVTADPGNQGIGTIVAGAVELSNTEIGSNLIDLILASTMYRGNTRVITTAQQMLDELLALRR